MKNKVTLPFNWFTVLANRSAVALSRCAIASSKIDLGHPAGTDLHIEEGVEIGNDGIVVESAGEECILRHCAEESAQAVGLASIEPESPFFAR
jgi:hypothetical protein